MQTPSTSSSGALFSAGSGENGDTGFNSEAKFKALNATVADLVKQTEEMREKLDRYDGENAEVRLLVEKYQNR